MQETSSTHRNIQAICAMEQEALTNRTSSARFVDAMAIQAGKLWFAIAHVLWFAIWIGLNTRLFNLPPFDPFPFSLLTLVVSLESIFLSLIIVMSQNRSNVQADRRNHLDLQINLLSEDENTKMLQMLQALCQHHGLRIGDDPEIEELALRTQVDAVVAELQKNLPEN